MAEPARRRRRVRPASETAESTAAETAREAALEAAAPEPAGSAPVGSAPVGSEAAGSGSGSGSADAGNARAETSPVADAPVVGVIDLPVEPDADITPSERGLRGLVGGGSSQIKPAAALRARDAARPRPEDLARAEEELTIVRRHWTPRE